jgi:four helix bundle protein
LQKAAEEIPTRSSNVFVIAMGSASELEYLLFLAYELGYLQSNIYQSIKNDLVEMRRMLNSFIQTLKANR